MSREPFDLDPVPMRRSGVRRAFDAVLDLARSLVVRVRDRDPTVRVALVPFLLLTALLFARSPATNFIFDEQEALLANPYVNAQQGLGYLDAFHRDFWGLPPDASIGSYRPLPNLLWRAVWSMGAHLPEAIAHIPRHPFVHHLLNLPLHALNAALLASFVFGVSRRRSLGWFAGFTFVCTAVLTEAVSGIVGLADVLGGLGALLALSALRLPGWKMPLAVFGAVLLGMFAKESALVCVLLVPAGAWATAERLHPRSPRRLARAALAFGGAAAAFVLYVELRKRWFPSPLPEALLRESPTNAPRLARIVHDFMVWFHQAPLPKDPLNNPLVAADTPHRIAGALRVYWRSLAQLVAPLSLSGDYSFPQEPVPETLLGWETLAGGALMALPPLAGVTLALRARGAGGRPSNASSPSATWSEVSGSLVALGLVWVVGSYFPHSNIPVVLPTVRAERFLYFPAIGSSLVFAAAMAWCAERATRSAHPAAARFTGLALGAFFGLQGVRAFDHSMDYRSDVDFWHATTLAVPRSAKAHLNYSVMVGARGDLATRLAESRIATELAPDWAMAHIYTGDTLCRMDRGEEAWPHYARGFELGPNDRALIALALQCMHDKDLLLAHEGDLRAIADRQVGNTWIAYLATDTLANHEKNKGVDPKHRPRGYNEGARDD